MKKFYITTPIYYINDKPHIGHAYTTVAADILARYYRMLLGSSQVFFLTGTDEHGAKIETKAKEMGMEPQIFADETSAKFQFAWDRLSISNNDFIRTTQPRHKKFVVDVLERMKKAVTPLGNPALYEGEYEGLYCVGCETFKMPEDLDANGLCPDHLVKPEMVKEKNWFFRLSDYAELLRKLIIDEKLEIRPEGRKNEIVGLIDTGLRDLAISRPSVSWGIPLPWDKDQTCYVWVDALSNYISALGGEDSENYKKFWPADLHLMSKDILKFHSIIWPAILACARFPLPKTVFAHGFFTIDGQKMSKTLGNVIDPNDLVDKFGTDAARYLLISPFGFGTDGDISMERFQEIYNAHLAGGLGNLVARVTAMAEKYFNGSVPKVKSDDIFETKKIWLEYHQAMKDYRLDEALRVVWHLIGKANKYIDDQKPWELAKSNPGALEEVLFNLLEAIRQIAVMVQPFMPDMTNKIFETIGLDAAKELEDSLEHLQKWARLPASATIKKGEILFPRI